MGRGWFLCPYFIICFPKNERASRGLPTRFNIREGVKAMSTYMHIDVTDTTATKETEIQFNRMFF